MHIKEYLSLIAIGLTFIGFYPYIIAIYRNKIKPHIFSWVIWGATTFIIFLAQLQSGGGAGAWPIGISGVITLYVAILSYFKKSDVKITKVDWTFFIVAMASIPLWYFTNDPTWSVIILTSIDIIGFGPTIRKAYHQPHEENITFFTIFFFRNIIAAIALVKYSLSTLLFPVATGLVCLVLIGLLIIRRKLIKKTNSGLEK